MGRERGRGNPSSATWLDPRVCGLTCARSIDFRASLWVVAIEHSNLQGETQSLLAGGARVRVG